ncbi:MAG: NnrU family protein [Paracoccus sp. (in: a-proteobacteria)]
MLILILGLALWWGAHLFTRIMPELRARFGDAGRGGVAAVIILSVLLMIWGYRAAPVGTVWWGPSAMLKGINNLLVLISFYLFAASGMKTRLANRLEHPMLSGFTLWAFAHLLVNGDLPSLVLFGGLMVWALVEVVVIGRTGSDQQTQAGDVLLYRDGLAFIAALIVYGVAGMIHSWLGYNPFGG